MGTLDVYRTIDPVEAEAWLEGTERVIGNDKMQQTVCETEEKMEGDYL